MEVKEIKKIQRGAEQLYYQREMFWHEPEKQNLIKELLQKIYDLEDKVELLTKHSDIDFEKIIKDTNE